MSALADLLETELGDIVEEWRARVVATLAPESVDKTLIVDSLPDYLQLIANDLRSQGVARASGETIHATRIPADHGVQRFHLGYEVGAMVREYALVRDVVFDRMEASGHAFALWESRALSR